MNLAPHVTFPRLLKWQEPGMGGPVEMATIHSLYHLGRQILAPRDEWCQVAQPVCGGQHGHRQQLLLLCNECFCCLYSYRIQSSELKHYYPVHQWSTLECQDKFLSNYKYTFASHQLRLRRQNQHISLLYFKDYSRKC